MSTRALVLGSMADDRATAQKAVEGFQEYCDTVFPFLKKAAEVGGEADRKRLLQHVQHPMQIDVASVLGERAQTARTKAAQKYRVRKDPR